MANLSRQNIKNHFPFTLEIKPYWHDHFFEGKAILPAVEALIVLAGAVRGQYPQANLQMLTQASFPRMLIIDPALDRQGVQLEIESSESGISASLLTSVKINNGAMSRTLEHARATFSKNMALPPPTLTCRDARKMASECINVPAATIYRELIPFGAAYQNIVSDLSVSEEGALADISGGNGEANDQLLGSPFVLDAAMHAACVWGQRFADIVSFPVGFDRRIIYNTTRTGMSYCTRIKPVSASGGTLIFHAWIFDSDGILCENIHGLQMRDISQGRLRPPRWIKEGV